MGTDQESIDKAMKDLFEEGRKKKKRKRKRKRKKKLKTKMKDEVFPSQVLLEISRGYSVFTVNNKNYYFKHFSIEEMLELEEFEKNQMIVAQKEWYKDKDRISKRRYEVWRLDSK